MVLVMMSNPSLLRYSSFLGIILSVFSFLPKIGKPLIKAKLRCSGMWYILRWLRPPFSYLYKLASFQLLGLTIYWYRLKLQEKIVAFLSAVVLVPRETQIIKKATLSSRMRMGKIDWCLLHVHEYFKRINFCAY